jgi:hypothetical protein
MILIILIEENRKMRELLSASSLQPPWNVPFQMAPQLPQYLQPWSAHGHYDGSHSAQMGVQYNHTKLSYPKAHAEVILSVLQGLNLDQSDINAIQDSAETIPWKYRKQTQQVLVAREFYDWASTPKSCTLLIEGPNWKDSFQAGQAMAWVSATFTEVLRTRDHFISLAFFCGRHVEPEDAPIGGTALISSFVAQLIQQHYAETTFDPQDIDLESLGAGDLRTLCDLFARLVRQLPRHQTLICIIDSVDAYETSELEDDMRMVLHHLLNLAKEESVSATFKILVTSVTGTLGVHEEFQDEDANVLLMESLQSSLEDVSEWESGEDSDQEW